MTSSDQISTDASSESTSSDGGGGNSAEFCNNKHRTRIKNHNLMHSNSAVALAATLASTLAVAIAVGIHDTQQAHQ